MKYNICMFAYNEELNIEKSIKSVFNNSDESLDTFYLLANGCTDNTVNVANKIKSEINFQKLQIVQIDIGDKCNAWNTYIHTLASNQDVHFFVDADVEFSKGSFQILANKLYSLKESYVAVAGLPLAGRNKNYYETLVKDKACIFGNFYGVRRDFIQKLKFEKFYLPKGLCWIDSFITKAINTDLNLFANNLEDRVCYVESVGYSFRSLSIFQLNDIKTYINRISRYELGKIQEKYLDKLNYKNWPESMDEINKIIINEYKKNVKELNLIKKILVRKRLFKKR